MSEGFSSNQLLTSHRWPSYTSLDTCQMKLNYYPKKGNQAWTKSRMFYQRNKIFHDKQKSKEKTQAASRCCALLRQ